MHEIYSFEAKLPVVVGRGVTTTDEGEGDSDGLATGGMAAGFGGTAACGGVGKATGLGAEIAGAGVEPLGGVGGGVEVVGLGVGGGLAVGAGVPASTPSPVLAVFSPSASEASFSLCGSAWRWDFTLNPKPYKP